MVTHRTFIAITCLTLALPALAAGQSAPRQVRVAFKPGSSSATVTGTVKGYDTVDYLLGARRGQTMRVTLKSANLGNSFNVLPPGSDAAIGQGELSDNDWTGDLPADGEYRVRVFLPRSAARRNESASFTLSFSITGHADAKVPGTKFHATGDVACSVGTDPKGSSRCSFGVIRTGQGKAEVHLGSPGFDVRLHPDQVRVLRFDNGQVTSADPKEKVTVERQDDNWLVAVNGFHYYTIPDAVIVGG